MGEPPTISMQIRLSLGGVENLEGNNAASKTGFEKDGS